MVTLPLAPGGHNQNVALADRGTMLADLLTDKRHYIPNSKRSDSPRLNATFCQKSAGHLALNFAGTNTPCEKLAR
jgi:hypothetical protein